MYTEEKKNMGEQSAILWHGNDWGTSGVVLAGVDVNISLKKWPAGLSRRPSSHSVPTYLDQVT